LWWPKYNPEIKIEHPDRGALFFPESASRLWHD
jgi:hypothetical protein